MKKSVALTLTLILSAFHIACGGRGANGPTAIGNFSDASLKGQYTYHLIGTDLATGADFSEAGVFTADGAEHITSGIDDFNEAGIQNFGIPLTGTYQINSDGTGTLMLTRTILQQQTFTTLAVSLIDASTLYIVGADTSANSSGRADLQDSSAFSAPSGSYSFTLHTRRPTSVGAIGDMTLASGSVSSGSEDQNVGGVTSAQTLTGGAFDPPDNTGRGTGTLIDDTPATMRFIYYVIDASTIRIFPIDASVIGIGHAEKQTGNFTDASLTGNFAFGTRGETTVGAVRTVGRFTSDGLGNLSAGAFDSARDDGTLSATFNTGTYTPMAANGRTVLTFNASTGNVTEILRMVSPARAFVLVSDPTKVEDGTLDAQTVGAFATSTLTGQYSFFMDGFDATSLLDRVGTVQWDGSGKLHLAQIVNRHGNVVPAPEPLSGTYSITGDGRVVASVSGLSSNLILYLVSGSEGYMLQGDPDTEVDGRMKLQQ